MALLFPAALTYIDIIRAQTSDQLDMLYVWHTSCLSVDVLGIIVLTLIYAHEFIQRILAIDIRSNAGA